MKNYFKGIGLSLIMLLIFIIFGLINVINAIIFGYERFRSGTIMSDKQALDLQKTINRFVNI